jgi:hypothetical protein
VASPDEMREATQALGDDEVLGLLRAAYEQNG